MELSEWELEVRAHQYKRMAQLAERIDHGLNTKWGVRWYHAEGPVWMIGDGKYVVPIILREPTDDPLEALDRALRGEMRVP
jgi:hypothetical protein